MLGTSHKILGVAAGIAALNITGISAHDRPFQCAGFIAVSVLGSLLPDADQPNSTIGKELYIAWLPIYIIRGLVKVFALLIPPLKTVVKAMAHRGMAHTPFLWTVICGALYFALRGTLWQIYVIALAVGVASHILSDLLFGGIPLMFPFSLKRIKLPLCLKTGGYMEFVTTGLCTTYIIMMAYTGIKGLLDVYGGIS